MLRSLIMTLAVCATGGLCAWASVPAHRGANVCPDDPCRPREGRVWIWISPEQIRSLPMSGAEWDARGAPWFENRGVYYYAQQDTSQPLVGFQDDSTDVHVLAKALVWLRLKQEATPAADAEHYRAEVQDACLAARGTEYQGPDQTTLALGRNLLGYVLAANLIDWDNSVPGRRERDFRDWVDVVRSEVFDDGSGLVFRTLIEAHEQRPNNWGLMCGASRLAAAIYLCDVNEEGRCWDVFRRWLGDTTSSFEFRSDDWGGLSWQRDRSHPVGINPRGARKIDCGSVMRSIDGVMPDDMRRSGPFDATAPCEPSWTWPAYPGRGNRNYNWHAMQAVLAQAVLHSRRGRDAWTVGNYAIGRAFLWLYRELQFPVTDPDAGDDDYWQVHLANQIYPALRLPEPLPTKPGHQIGYTDWTTLEPSWPRARPPAAMH